MAYAYLAAWVRAARAQTPPAPASTRPSTSQASATIVVYSMLSESANNAFVAAFKQAYPGRDMRVLPLLNLIQSTTGSVKYKVEPFPSTLSAQILPPCPSMRCLAIAKPNPVPRVSLGVRTRSTL
jgi:hypothetical protein